MTLRSMGLVGSGSRVISAHDAPYNAAPDILPSGVATGVRAKIQQALDAASASTVTTFVEVTAPGTYTCELATMPGQAAPNAKDAMLWMTSNVTLRLGPGVTIKLADGQTLAAGSNQGYGICTKDPFSNATRENVFVVGGGKIDMNGDNQTLNAGVPRLSSGLFFGRTRRFLAENITVKNLKGTLSGPPGETFHFDTNRCANGEFINCEADGSGAVDTATGFSSNNSTNIGWTRCKAHDLAHGMGFTHWQSAGMHYTGCEGWRIARGRFGSAFNSERSVGVRYTQCNVGGYSNHLPPASQTTPNPFYPTDGESLYCHNGFNIQGSSDVIAVGCSARNCENVGINIDKNTGVTAPAFTGDTTSGSPVIANVAITNGGLLDLGYTVLGTGVPTGAAAVPNVVAGFKDSAGTEYGSCVGAGDPNNTIRMTVNSTATGAAVAFTTSWDCHSVQFIGGDVRGSTTTVNIGSAQTDIRLQVKESATLADTFTEYGVATVIRNRFGSSGYRRSGESGAPTQRWLNSDGSVSGGFDSDKTFYTTGRKRAYREVSSTYSMIATDDVVVQTAASTVTLPSNAGLQSRTGVGASQTAQPTFEVWNESGSAISIVRAAGVLINGVDANYSLAAGLRVTLMWNGTNWRAR